MSKIKKISRRLREAIGVDTMVRLSRVSREGQTVEGFVLAVGREWALLACVVAGGYFDGHLAIRLDEVRAVRSDRTFQSAFSRTRSEWPPAQPEGVTPDLDSIAGVLASLVTSGALFGIERDRKYDALWIGVANELTRRWLYLWEVRPDATWRDHPLGYRLRTITMVRIGDHYLRALATCAGPAPDDASPSDWAAGRG